LQEKGDGGMSTCKVKYFLSFYYPFLIVIKIKKQAYESN
jgi:hypothetical protein